MGDLHTAATGTNYPWKRAITVCDAALVKHFWGVSRHKLVEP